MGRLKILQPRVRLNKNREPKTLTTKEHRTTGRALQKIRLKMWTEDPHCKKCHSLTQFPYGFEIDHITPLFEHGNDAPENRQLLCIDCHEAKTKLEKSMMR